MAVALWARNQASLILPSLYLLEHIFLPSAYPFSLLPSVPLSLPPLLCCPQDLPASWKHSRFVLFHNLSAWVSPLPGISDPNSSLLWSILISQFCMSKKQKRNQTLGLGIPSPSISMSDPQACRTNYLRDFPEGRTSRRGLSSIHNWLPSLGGTFTNHHPSTCGYLKLYTVLADPYKNCYFLPHTSMTS